MKILNWMHDKLRHNSIKPFKDLNFGNSCIRLSTQASVDDQELYPKANLFTSSKHNKPETENYSLFEENDSKESSSTISEIFHGFLTIGTLGSEASFTESGTPTFASTLEYISDGAITEHELKLIDFELKSFLEEEGTEDCSARNSNISIITLGPKQTEKSESEDYWKNLVCPIPEFAYEERDKLKKEKIVTTENHAEKRDDKTKQKSAMRFMKKLIKKVNPSSTKKALSHPTDLISPAKKFPKVMRIFHRKIHPESSTADTGPVTPIKFKAKETLVDGAHTNRNLTRHLGGDDKTTDGNRGNTDRTIQPQESNLSCYSFRGKGEHWINIDDDYLVLELDQQKE